VTEIDGANESFVHYVFFNIEVSADLPYHIFMRFVPRSLMLDRPGTLRWVVSTFLICAASETQYANASCGDYLHASMRSHQFVSMHGSDSSRAPIFATRGDEPALDEQSTEAQRQQGSPGPARCSGPSCQQAPVQPLSIPTTDPVRSSFKDLFVAIERPMISESARSPQWPDADTQSGHTDCARIERPPQTV